MTVDDGGENVSASHRYGRGDPHYVQNMHHFIHGMPKAELHVHFEGTLTPWHLLRLSQRNGVSDLPTDIAGFKQMLSGSVLTQFLDGLARARTVLITEQDFYEVAFDFAVQQLRNNVLYTELLFDPQGHTDRGIAFDTMMQGLVRACTDAREKLGIRIELVMQLHRDKSRESAYDALAGAARWKHVIRGVGMDNGPIKGYAEKLQPVMQAARAMGFELSGHIDRYELDHAHNLDFLLNTLKVNRVDHGINIIDSPALIPTAKERGVTFTVCGATLYTHDPCMVEDSGFKLYARRIVEMTNAGLNTTINTDDPGYFIDFYLNDMIKAFYEENGHTRQELINFQRRAFQGAWMPEADKQHYLAMLDAYAEANT
jgi:adenosine deaminase